ncbi:MAG: hypothetical protein AAF495_26095 [Pseudomonadota bacterium]
MKNRKLAPSAICALAALGLLAQSGVSVNALASQSVEQRQAIKARMIELSREVDDTSAPKLT